MQFSVYRSAVEFNIRPTITKLLFQCLTGHAPAYLADDCQLAADASARRLRSADTDNALRRVDWAESRRCKAPVARDHVCGTRYHSA